MGSFINLLKSVFFLQSYIKLLRKSNNFVVSNSKIYLEWISLDIIILLTMISMILNWQFLLAFPTENITSTEKLHVEFKVIPYHWWIKQYLGALENPSSTTFQTYTKICLLIQLQHFCGNRKRSPCRSSKTISFIQWNK